MCRSVPQMPVHKTRIFTSLIPGSGSGTSANHRPQAARLFTRAFIPAPLEDNRSNTSGRAGHTPARHSLSSHFLRYRERLRPKENGGNYKMALDGKILGKFGSAGKQLKEFGAAREIVCRNPNEVYLGELTNWRVQKLTLHPEKRPVGKGAHSFVSSALRAFRRRWSYFFGPCSLCMLDTL